MLPGILAPSVRHGQGREDAAPPSGREKPTRLPVTLPRLGFGETYRNVDGENSEISPALHQVTCARKDFTEDVAGAGITFYADPSLRASIGTTYDGPGGSGRHCDIVLDPRAEYL